MNPKFKFFEIFAAQTAKMIKLKFLIFYIFFSSGAVFAENEDKKEVVVEDAKVYADVDGKEEQELAQREFDTIGKFY